MSTAEEKVAVATNTAAPLAEEMKRKYGEIYRLDLTLAPDDDTEIELTYIFRRPSTASFNRYMKNMSNDMIKASKAFLKDSIVPEQAELLEQDWERYPALVMSLGDKLLTMLGLSKSANLTTL